MSSGSASTEPARPEAARPRPARGRGTRPPQGAAHRYHGFKVQQHIHSIGALACLDGCKHKFSARVLHTSTCYIVKRSAKFQKSRSTYRSYCFFAVSLDKPPSGSAICLHASHAMLEQRREPVEVVCTLIAARSSRHARSDLRKHRCVLVEPAGDALRGLVLCRIRHDRLDRKGTQSLRHGHGTHR